MQHPKAKDANIRHPLRMSNILQAMKGVQIEHAYLFSI